MSDPLETFLSASVLDERVGAFVQLVRASREAGFSGTGRSRVAGLLEIAEADPGKRDAFLAALSALLAGTDGASLFGDVGIPGDRGFFAELADRVSARLVPSARDARDLSGLFQRLFRSDAEVEGFLGLPLSDVHRLVRFVEGGLSPEARAALTRGFVDGFRLLLARIQGHGLSTDLRTRGTPGPVGASPFHRVLLSGDALVEDWLAGRDTAQSLQAFGRDSGACRKECRVVQQRLEESGVSVHVVFGLEVIDRCLTRTALMAEVMTTADGPDRSRAVHRLLSRLVLLGHQDRSARHLVKWNLHLLDRKIVDRSGKTGEHYVAANPSEYRHIWVAAAGGGLLTVVTAAFKMLFHEWHLAPFPESFLYGLNYAVSFLLMQAFGFVLATKQPAMTAAALAQILREGKGEEDREEKIAGFFTRLTSSQLAAATSNVLSVAVGSAVFVALWQLLFGRPWVDEKTARDTFLVLSPLDSGTAFFAALTGVLLWMGSLAGGWFENWSTYHRLPEGIARHPLGNVVGRERMERFGEALSRNASGWATNVALGFLLGFAPAVGRFFGIPFDVRHVTLSTGQLALASASLGERWFGEGALLRGLAGIATMFVLNLSVAFWLSLLNAASAYGTERGEVRGVMKQVVKRIARRPLDFVRPPKATATEAA
ncbi:MAG: gliding motility protein [Thermoanaerobaculia bacterium]